VSSTLILAALSSYLAKVQLLDSIHELFIQPVQRVKQDISLVWEGAQQA
jgi:hypothetical protein